MHSLKVERSKQFDILHLPKFFVFNTKGLLFKDIGIILKKYFYTKKDKILTYKWLKKFLVLFK